MTTLCWGNNFVTRFVTYTICEEKQAIWDEFNSSQFHIFLVVRAKWNKKFPRHFKLRCYGGFIGQFSSDSKPMSAIPIFPFKTSNSWVQLPHTWWQTYQRSTCHSLSIQRKSAHHFQSKLSTSEVYMEERSPYNHTTSLVISNSFALFYFSSP